MSDTFLKIPFLLFLSLFALKDPSAPVSRKQVFLGKKQSAAFQYYRLLQNHVFISHEEFFFFNVLHFSTLSCIHLAPRSTSTSSRWNSLSPFLLYYKGKLTKAMLGAPRKSTKWVEPGNFMWFWGHVQSKHHSSNKWLS